MATASAARLATRAVDTAALGTGAAPVHYALAQGLTGPEHAHACVAGGDACLSRVVLNRDAVDVDAPQSQRVLFLQRLRQACHAAADGVAFIKIRLGVFIELARECPQEHGRSRLRGDSDWPL